MITAGDVLKNKRQSLRISLENASLETKIQKRFLKAIEANDFSLFESEVFLTGFIKIYASYLNLDVEKTLALYRRSNQVKQKKENKIAKTPLVTYKGRTYLTPKTLITVILTLFALGIIAYILLQIYNFQKPPLLKITEPNPDSTTTQETIKLKGQSEKNSTVQINDVAIQIDENGYFEKEMSLVEGPNLITVKSKKNNNNILETVVTVKVTYSKPQVVQKTEQPVQNIVKLQIIDSPAWIKLDIDDENKLVQVVNPSTQEFPIKEKLRITSGRLTSTKLYFNEKEISWPTSTIKGVAVMECAITNNELQCK